MNDLAMDLPIARTSLHEEVTGRLRDMIVEGRLKPSERIAELEVAKALGVSRTPVREALKVLASEGLVELLPLRGAVVKAFTPKDAQDMLEMIALLEEHAGRAACAAPDDEIAAIVAMHERMRVHFERRERPEYFALNQQIWGAAMTEPEEMIAALTARDGDRLARAMQAHLANTWPRVSAMVIGPDGAV